MADIPKNRAFKYLSLISLKRQFNWVRVAQTLIVYVQLVHCVLLFVYWSFFFFSHGVINLFLTYTFECPSGVFRLSSWPLHSTEIVEIVSGKIMRPFLFRLNAFLIRVCRNKTYYFLLVLLNETFYFLSILKKVTGTMLSLFMVIQNEISSL